MLVKILKPFGWALMRLLFSVEYKGIENIPENGPAIIAGNHPSYLDPVLIGLPVKRQIRFMAWDALFKVPLLGTLIRAMGAFPVDIRKGRGESAYREALDVLKSGDILGIFPEGQRSERGPMGELKTGVARLALDTGAPVIPVTIGGAVRAWPKYKLLPKPARIVVRYHKPIQLDESDRVERKNDREYHNEIMGILADRINMSLLPHLRSGESIERWYSEPPSNIRSFEWAPLIATVIAVIVGYYRGTISSHWAGVIIPSVFYYLYLAADLSLIKPSRTAKWIRNSMPTWLILLWHYPLTAATGLPAGEMNTIFVIAGLAAFFNFFYENYFTLQKFVRGIVASYYYSLLLLLKWPHGLGTFTAVIGFIVIFVMWYEVKNRWPIALAMSFALGSVLWLRGDDFGTLLIFAVLAFAIIAYLQTLISIAYDIRTAGNVSE